MPCFKCNSTEHFEQTGLQQSSQVIFDGLSKPNAWPHNLKIIETLESIK